MERVMIDCDSGKQIREQLTDTEVDGREQLAQQADKELEQEQQEQAEREQARQTVAELRGKGWSGMAKPGDVNALLEALDVLL